MATRAAGVTVRVADPEIDPDSAVIVAVPAPTLTAPPLPSIVATAGAEDVHDADAVSSLVLPSVYVPVAMYCCVVPGAIDADCGVTAIDTRLAAPTGGGADCSEEEHPAVANSAAKARMVPRMSAKQTPDSLKRRIG